MPPKEGFGASHDSVLRAEVQAPHLTSAGGVGTGPQLRGIWLEERSYCVLQGCCFLGLVAAEGGLFGVFFGLNPWPSLHCQLLQHPLGRHEAKGKPRELPAGQFLDPQSPVGLPSSFQLSKTSICLVGSVRGFLLSLVGIAGKQRQLLFSSSPIHASL